MVEEKAAAKVPKKGEDMIRAVCCMHACNWGGWDGGWMISSSSINGVFFFFFFWVANFVM